MPTREEIARAICEAWGCTWQSAPPTSDLYAAERDTSYSQQLTKQHFYAAADAAIALCVPPTEAEGRTAERHRFQAHHRFAWFCTICGYGPGEKSKHLPQADALVHRAGASIESPSEYSAS